MNKQTYAEKLRDPRWQKKRLVILQRDRFSCRCCGDTKTTLNIHHLSYCGDPWDSKDADLLTVCEHCHWVITNFQYDISDSFGYAFSIATKFEREDGSFILIFQGPDEISIIKISVGNYEPIIVLEDDSMHRTMGTIMANWACKGKEKLSIDQSPSIYGA